MEHTELSEYADREVAQIEAHRKIYAAKNPPPEPPKLASGDTWLMLVGLNILYVAAVIVSAPHTIPLFLQSVDGFKLLGVDVRYIVGGAAFTLIELALIILTFIRIRMRSRTRDGWEEGLDGVNKWLKLSLILVFTVALFANVYSTLNSSSHAEPQQAVPQNTLADYRLTSTDVSIVDSSDKDGWLERHSRTAIFLMIGAAAPMLALFVGDMSAILWLQRSAKHKEEQAAHDLKMAAWKADCNAAYRPAKLRGVSTAVHNTSTEDRLQVSTGQDNRQVSRQDNGRRMDAGQYILAYLRDHPADANRPVRDLANLLGMKDSTVGKYQLQFRRERGQSEG